jgi:rhamnosyltransferase
MTKKISVIIRTFNEEEWLHHCLEAIKLQDSYSKDRIDIIIVDSGSSDNTLEIAQSQEAEIIHISDYKPGKALNIGIENAIGEIIVIISAHCIPKNNNWLSSIIKPLDQDDIVGVYGRQLPLSSTSSEDARDLYITFGPEKIHQKKNPFFHNANSAFRKTSWEEIKFDDEVNNIEDRLWAEQWIKRGKIICYEPEAEVYHHHGIHQYGNIKRADGTKNVLKKHYGEFITLDNIPSVVLDISGLVMIKDSPLRIKDSYLIEKTIALMQNDSRISNIFLFCNCFELPNRIKEIPNVIIIDRTNYHETNNIEEDYKYFLEQVETQGFRPDFTLCMSETYPLREAKTVKKLIDAVLNNPIDLALSVKKEFRNTSSTDVDDNSEINNFAEPRSRREAFAYIEYWGHGFIARPKILKSKKLGQTRKKLVIADSDTSFIEVRSQKYISLLLELLKVE